MVVADVGDIVGDCAGAGADLGFGAEPDADQLQFLGPQMPVLPGALLFQLSEH